MVMPFGTSELVDKAEIFASSLLSVYLSDELVFHNLRHTRQVVNFAGQISRYINLSAEQEEVLLIAAWFHDTGYILEYKGHEDASVLIAKQFLQQQGWRSDRIRSVTDCIMATKMPQSPKAPLDEALCDADLYHLAADDYPDYLARLRSEWKWAYEQWDPDEEWILLNLEFLAQHSYFTSFGQEKLEAGKKKEHEVLAWKTIAIFPLRQSPSRPKDQHTLSTGSM